MNTALGLSFSARARGVLVRARRNRAALRLTARHLLVAVACAGVAAAEPLTGPDQMDPCGVGTLLTFESLTPGAITSPLTIGDFTFSAGPGLGVVSIAGFGANGSIVNGLTLHPLPSASLGTAPYTTLTIELRLPAREFGLGWFDPNFTGNLMRVYNSAGTLLEEIAPQLGPPGGCCASWRGVRRPTNEIARIEIIPADGTDVFTIDHVRATIPPLISPQPPSSALLCPGAARTLSVSAFGTGPITYQWRRDTTPIPGATGATYEIAAAGPGDVGLYDCVVADACGSTTSTPIRVAICRIDYNGDDEIDFSDSELFVLQYGMGTLGTCAPGADLNEDGEVDFSDIERFIQFFNAGC